MNAPRLFGSALVLLAALPAAGCYASNVVAREDRAVVVDATALAFAPATADDVGGLFASIAIEGDAAASLRHVVYWFGPDGRYSGAALIDGADGAAFQTLTGAWRVEQGALVLDDGPPADLGVAEGHLRIAADGGVLVLRKVTLR